MNNWEALRIDPQTRLIERLREMISELQEMVDAIELRPQRGNERPPQDDDGFGHELDYFEMMRIQKQ